MRKFNTPSQNISLLLFGFVCFSFFSIAISEAAETVKLQLKWKHQFQFAGYYAAIEQGYYAEEDLDVILIEGKPGGNEIEEVLSGRADIGVGMSDILLARFQGKPLVVLANIFQHSPVILLTTKESGYISPQDLYNQKVSMSPFVKSAELQAMFTNEGISIDKITLIKPSWNLDDLIYKKVDAIAGYISSQPYTLKKRNIPYNVISPTTYGIDFYGDNLFTSESEIKEHPKRVASFRKASLKGWQYALANPEEIVELILSKYKGGNKNLSREFLQNEAAVYQKLILPEFVEIGHMNPGRWKHIAETYIKLGMADKKYSLKGLLYNPKPVRFDWGHRVVKWGGVAISIGFGTTLLFMFFNRRLKREIKDRRQTEKQLRESEERFKVLYDYAPLPYQSLDANGHFVEVNQTWLELVGYRKDEVIGKSFAEFLHPDWADHFKKNFSKFKSIGEILGVEFQLQKKDGDLIWVIFDGKIRRNHVGTFIQTHCVFTDITKQKQLNKKLEEQELILQKAHKMEAIGTLAGGIAHDFNNILSAIIGFSELAKDDIPADSNAADDIDQVIIASRRAADLVQQILTFSRKSDHCLELLAPHLIIKEALKMLRSSLPVTIDILEDIDIESGTIMADPTNIHQIIVNLCTNSLHAMEKEKGTLSVSLHQKEVSAKEIMGEQDIAPGSFIVLEVSDTGSGMDKTTLERIFDPYFTTKEVGKGTGLGLAVIHGIIHDYRGFIRVKSELGKGTSFYVYFPVSQQKTPATAGIEPVESLPSGTERILIVDDESMIININRTVLDRLGYKVSVTTDSLDALDIIRTDPDRFDLIVTDQTMANMTGAELAQEILKINHNMPIILCTGYSSVLSQEEALELGIKKYMTKPVNRKTLAKVVRQVLDQK